MKDAQEFKQSQLPKQEEAIFEAITKAERSANPVIELAFLIYPELEAKLNEAGWRVLGTYQCAHEGKIKWYTHLCPTGVDNQEKKPSNGEKFFGVAGDL